MVYDLTRKCEEGVRCGDIRRCNFGKKPKPGESTGYLLKGIRPVLVLARIGRSVIILPLTSSDTYNICDIVFKFGYADKTGYPRFNAITNVDIDNILTKTEEFKPIYYGNIIDIIGYDSYKKIVDYIYDLMLDRSDYSEKLSRKLCEKNKKKCETDIVEINMAEIKEVKIPENNSSKPKKKKSKHKNSDIDFANMRIVKKYGESFVKDSLTSMTTTEFMDVFGCSKSTEYRLRQATGILAPKRR